MYMIFVCAIMLHKIIMSVWQGDTLFFVDFDEASCRVVSCLCKKVIWQETRVAVGLKPAGNRCSWSNNLQETEN